MKKTKRTSTVTLSQALIVLIQCLENGDEIAQGVLLNSAKRLVELQELLRLCLPHVQASAEAEHMLDGFGKRRKRPTDILVERIKAQIK